MRNQSDVADDKMSVTRVEDPIWLGHEARRMSRALLKREHHGPGDTIEAAAYRLQTKHKVPVAPVILQCWNRPPREMLVSRWMTIFAVFWAEFGERADAAYEEKRKATNAHPVLLRLADFVAGRTNGNDDAPSKDSRSEGSA